METEDESTAYLKLFNDGPHNYLLHSGEDGLNDSFPVEPIFTEIASDWSSDQSFPIFLSAPLVADDTKPVFLPDFQYKILDNDSESRSTNVQLLTEENENSSQNEDVKKDNSVTVYSDGNKNKLILSNDVLLKLEQPEENFRKEKTVTHVINGENYSVTYTQDSQDENVEVIQLLNIDGTVTTLNKNFFNVIQREKTVNFENFYTQVQAQKCKLCSFLCENVEDITAHINLKHGKELQMSQTNRAVPPNGTKMTSILNINNDRKKYTLYICSNCGSGYSNREDLRKHMISQHRMIQVSTAPPATQDKVPPDKPETVANKKSSLLAICANFLKKQKAQRKVKCSIKGCPLRFDKEESLKRHEECHVNGNKKQFMCLVCKTKFSIWRICSMHMWKCHSIDLDLLTCPMCNDFKSFTIDRVMKHMAIHSEEKPFICTSCGNAFKQLNQLRNHEVIHKGPYEVSSSFTSQQCEFCDAYFANSKCLKKHIKFVHDKFKPFICNICGHQTARKEMLQLHYRQHTGDKPYHCTYCEYKTGDRNCLRKHMMRHFGVAKYSCPYCDYQSIQTTSYKTHLAHKHPGKEGTYACTLCKYTTINCRTYLSHVKCHELENKKKIKVEKRPVEDNESKSSEEAQNFLNTEHSEEAVDTGGITIPATFDLQLNDQTSLI